MKLHRTHSRLNFGRARASALFVALAIPTGRPSIEIKGFELVESQDQKKLLELSADVANVYKNEGLTALENLRGRTWGTQTKPFLIKGKVGVLDSNSQDFQVYNESHVTSPDGYEFATESLHYNATQRILTSQDPVQAHPQNAQKSFFQLSGQGLKIMLNENIYEILKNVKASQQLSQTNTLHILSQSSLIQPSENMASFFKSVSVKSPTIDLRGDKLTMYFSKNPQNPNNQVPEKLVMDATNSRKISAKLSKMKLSAKGLVAMMNAAGELIRTDAIGSAQGETNDGVKLVANQLSSFNENGVDKILLKDNVTIITSNRDATCEEAEFFPDSGEIVLKGVATVKSAKQIIEGDLIRYSTKGSEIIVEKARGTMNKDEVTTKPKKSAPSD